MSGIFNFCAGPAMLPTAVMATAQKEFINWQNIGSSVMELSHRSPQYMGVAKKAEADLRDLMHIPDNYKVLFVHGGGRGQFSAVPMNLLSEGQTADYILTGSWSKGAAAEAKNYGNINTIEVIEKSEQGTFVTDSATWPLTPNAAYVHYCPNETVDGIEMHNIPETNGVPLVADMSSMILSREIDVTKFGLIYAGAQKNIGPSGLAIVIVREDLLGNARLGTPSIMNYQISADNDSMHNTPPTYAWYLAGLVFQWLKDLGGVEAISKVNQEKAALLYHYIDQSDLYQNPVVSENRSAMNVPFWLVDEGLNSKFLQEAEQEGLKALKGHRIVGGMRASIYNAMPIEGVQKLVDFMKQFEKRVR